MAIIGKIRSKMGILLVIIVGVALLAFILGDLFSSAGFWMMGDKMSVGEINGNKVKIDEFDARLKQKENFYMQVNQLSTVDQNIRQQLIEETWQEYIEKYINEKEYNKLGLEVGQAELQDLLTGKFVHSFIQQQFRNPESGAFDRSLVQNYINTYIMAEEGAIPEDKAEQWKLDRQRWAQIETMLEKDRRFTKYTTMVSKGLYVTSKEMQSAYNESADKSQFRFISKNFSEIPDSTVQITDEDLKKAYDENKFRFKINFAMRGVKYGLFEVNPTKADTTAIFGEINKLFTEFQSSTDDTSFVYQNSDIQNDPTYFTKEKLSKKVDSLLFNAANGFTYGPYYENGSYFIAKKLGEKVSPDSSNLKAILIARKGQDGKDNPKSKVTIDSLMTALKSGISFGALAVKHSQDQTTAKDSGNIGWVPEPFAPNPLLDTAWITPLNTYRLVSMPDAYAIINVTDRSLPTKKIKVAFVNRMVEPSKETENNIFNAASDFAGANKTKEDFEKSAKTGKYIIRDDNGIRDNGQGIMGVEDSKKMVKWAFENEVGTVSAIEKFGNKYVVAIITKARNSGVPAMNDIKEELEPFAKRNKKAETFIEQMKSASASGNIDQAAAALKTQVKNATDITFASYGIPGAGYEPAVIGTAFGATQGKLSEPIKGNYGVYVMVVDAFTKGQPQDAMNAQFMKMQLAQILTQRGQSEAVEALRAYLGIRDLRYKFEY